MRVDSNTSGHRQWFYFSMRGERKSTVRLHIHRFRKNYSLFQRGMRPYARTRNSDWHPAGHHLAYHPERHRNQYGVSKDTKSFVLSFSYTFEHDNEEVFLAAGVPYTYSFLQRQLTHYKQAFACRENLCFEVESLVKSMCGLDVPTLTLQHRMSSLLHHPKRIIIINARTHSGEAASSWVLDGFLNELAHSPQVEEWLLHSNIVLKIVPMLNPDGVYIGNYRTGIIGEDFNRRFFTGKKQFHPEVHALKKLVSQSKKEGAVELFLDLHGHSILKNSFIYGPAETDFPLAPRIKALPHQLWHSSKYFRMASCKFRTDRECMETARVYFQLKEEVLSFTCENSLGLYHNQSQTFQMLAADWQAFGQSLLGSLISCFSQNSELPELPLYYTQNAQKEKIKSSLSTEPRRKFTSNIRIAVQTSKNNKLERTGLRLPSTKKSLSPEKQQPHEVSREDELLEPKSFQEKTQDQRARDSKKTPVSRLIQNIINRRMQEQQATSSEDRLTFGRSITFDSSDLLKRQIDATIEDDPTLDMEPINQNFSDEYVSINDSDSDADDLPEQERNYLLEYIKSTHKTQAYDEEEEQPPEKTLKQKPKEPKISGFREIRFKSIEEMYEKEVESREPLHSNTRKTKLEAHKFKDSTAKTLVFKSDHHFEPEDASVLTFTHQKRLNERHRHRRTNNEPFLLLQRKQRLTNNLERPN